MFAANQIVGFFNQSYLQNKLMKCPNFWHSDTIADKLEVNQKNSWVGLVKRGHIYLVHETLKSAVS